ncbi:MAG: DNA recombination protein RmuC [Candidatus Cloacimonetes bacterium]|nr:DNA recombination protein RmuC [Candidatus Cloacimonadota bacterium]
MIEYIIIAIIFGAILIVVLAMNANKEKKLRSELEQLERKASDLELTRMRLETQNSELLKRSELLEQFRSEKEQKNEALKEATTQLVAKNERIEQLLKELEKLNEKIDAFQKENSSIKEQLARTLTTLDEEKKQTIEKLKLLEDSKEKLKLEFENLANKIFDAKSEKLTSTSKESLDGVLKPLKEQLTDFKKRVDDIYDKEAEERGFLKKEISDLKKLNERISEDALNLTSALKGDKKFQGDWGEVQLEMILEYSGLTRGVEYDVQVSLTSEEGDTFRPDIIVHLPEQKDIVVDSKVSLVAYTQYCSTDDPVQKQKALNEHITAIRTHIKLLSAKNYQNLKGINTLDFVLMFLPIEASYFVAINEDRELFQEAMSRNILIVCPSTLHMTLKMIYNIWKYEHQNKNAKDIAERGRLLYNKFRGFVETFASVGKKLEAATKDYDKAFNQLSEGKGNLIAQANELTKLGIQPDKPIDKELAEKAETSALLSIEEKTEEHDE